MSAHMPFVYDDGGRAVAGFVGSTGDCVVRAVAIASGRPYAKVYAVLSEGKRTQRLSKRERIGSRDFGVARKLSRSVRAGVNVNRVWFKRQMKRWGFRWVPTMTIGSGCRVHLVAGELPAGRLVVSVSKHYTAVVDGVVRDAYDPQRRTYWPTQGPLGKVLGLATVASERCVYGYWICEKPTKGAR